EYRNPPPKLVVTRRRAAVSEERGDYRWAAAAAFRTSASADNHRSISNHRGRQVYMACFDQYADRRTSARPVAPRTALLRDPRFSDGTISQVWRSYRFHVPLFLADRLHKLLRRYFLG